MLESPFGTTSCTTGIYERLRDPIRTPGPYLVEGAIAEEDGNVELNVDAARPFYLRERPYAA